MTVETVTEEAPAKSEWALRAERIDPIVRYVSERASASLVLKVDSWESLAAAGDEGRELFQQEVGERSIPYLLPVMAEALAEAAKACKKHEKRLVGPEDYQEIARSLVNSLGYRARQALVNACVNRGDRYAY
jgi:hypothetical protein